MLSIECVKGHFVKCYCEMLFCKMFCEMFLFCEFCFQNCCVWGALFGLAGGAGVPCTGALGLSLGKGTFFTACLPPDLFPVMSSAVLSIKTKAKRKNKKKCCFLLINVMFSEM